MQKRLNANLISYIYFWHLCFPLLICSSLLTDKCIFISCPSSNSPVYISFLSSLFSLLSPSLNSFFSTPQIQTSTCPILSYFSTSHHTFFSFLLLLTSAFHFFLTLLIISPLLVLQPLLLHRCICVLASSLTYFSSLLIFRLISFLRI